MWKELKFFGDKRLQLQHQKQKKKLWKYSKRGSWRGSINLKLSKSLGEIQNKTKTAFINKSKVIEADVDKEESPKKIKNLTKKQTLYEKFISNRSVTLDVDEPR